MNEFDELQCFPITVANSSQEWWMNCDLEAQPFIKLPVVNGRLQSASVWLEDGRQAPIYYAQQPDLERQGTLTPLPGWEKPQPVQVTPNRLRPITYILAVLVWLGIFLLRRCAR